MKLILTPHGTAELIDDSDIQVWASDTDQDFMEEFSGRDFLGEKDVEDIIEYLEEIDMLEPDEADDLDVEEQSLNPDEDDDEDDEGIRGPFDAYI